MSPTRPRRQVAALAATTRVVVSALSVAANLVLPDHRADGVRVFARDRFGFDRWGGEGHTVSRGLWNALRPYPALPPPPPLP